MDLFYSPHLSTGYYTMPEDESKHLIRVLRKEPGDPLFLTDGRGTLSEAVIENPDPKHCTVRIVNSRKEGAGRNYHLHIAIAPTKSSDRFEWFLEKATEIGIDEITPLICEHSERSRLNLDRLRKVMIAAMKQSLKSWLPLLHEPATFEKLVDRPFDGEKYIAYCGVELTETITKFHRKGAKTLILIGPEGDFSPEEMTLAKKAGFVPITLGKSRLRTETAGVVACSIISALNGS